MRCDLRKGGRVALAHVHAADQELVVSPLVEGNLHDGIVGNARPKPKALPGGGDAHPPSLPAVAGTHELLTLAVDRPRLGRLEHLVEAALHVQDVAQCGGLPRPQAVAPPEFDRVHTHSTGHYVHLLLDPDHHLRHAKAPERAGERVVGIDAVAVDL